MRNRDTHLQDKNYDEPAIDILRRIKENSASYSLTAPHSGDEELDQLFSSYNPSERADGSLSVERKPTINLVKRANEILINNQGKVGIDPPMVQALAYIERMATHLMRDISRKDYQELPFDSGFKEICKFNELTTNPSFDTQEFERFWDHFVRDFSADWPTEIDKKYGVLSNRITKYIGELSSIYREENYPESFIDSIWSGNLTHELIGLTDPR